MSHLRSQRGRSGARKRSPCSDEPAKRLIAMPQLKRNDAHAIHIHFSFPLQTYSRSPTPRTPGYACGSHTLSPTTGSLEARRKRLSRECSWAATCTRGVTKTRATKFEVSIHSGKEEAGGPGGRRGGGGGGGSGGSVSFMPVWTCVWVDTCSVFEATGTHRQKGDNKRESHIQSA